MTFTVEEGEKYEIGDVEIVSTIADVDPEDLRRLIRTKSGQTFNSLRVEQSVEDITLRVSEEGYAFARVRPRGARDYDNNTISLIYYIEEGPRAYIERINVIGNDRTVSMSFAASSTLLKAMRSTVRLSTRRNAVCAISGSSRRFPSRRSRAVHLIAWS